MVYLFKFKNFQATLISKGLTLERIGNTGTALDEDQMDANDILKPTKAKDELSEDEETLTNKPVTLTP